MLRVGAGALASFLIAGAALTGSASADTPADTKVVFTEGTTSDLTSANPFVACCGSDYTMLSLNYDYLFGNSKTDLTASTEGGLASAYEHNADSTEWTFTIRDGVKWSDGEPLTAADIAFTYNFIIDNDLSVFENYLKLKGAEPPTFTAPDDTTLIWKSPTPTIAPLTPPAIPILPEHVWSQYDGDVTAMKAVSNIPSVGSGPFTIQSWDTGQGFIMTRNENYWGEQPVIDEVDFRIFGNQEAMVQALKSGEIDYVSSLNPTLFNSLKGADGITTHEGPAARWDNFAFNFGGDKENPTNLPALNDLTLRRAIATAIDRQAIVDRILLGDAIPATTPTLPQSGYHWEPPVEEQYQFDIAKANQMLDDAGYADTNGDGVRNDPATGDELILDTFTITNLFYSNDTGKLIAGWLKQIGIDVHLIPVSGNKANDLWKEGDFDAFVWDWPVDPDPDFILSIFTTDACGSWSDGCFSDPKYDAMYAKQKTFADPAERIAYIAKMQDYLYQQVPEVILTYDNVLEAYRSDKWTNFTPVPGPDGFLLNGYGPWSYISLRPIAAGGTGSQKGISTGIWLLVVAGIIIIGGGIVLIRRGKSDEERA